MRFYLFIVFKKRVPQFFISINHQNNKQLFIGYKILPENKTDKIDYEWKYYNDE